VPGYLLDTNHLSAWERQDPVLLEHFRNSPPENLVWICPISLGEIEWGLRVTNSTDPQRQAECRRFIEENALGFVWPIDTTTRDSYAEIMNRIWRTHLPATNRVDTQRHLSELRVDVNDVWIAAVALEHGLRLLTADRMETIRECVPEIAIENWLV
jgi:tRNA(fMet)-specific endonuclease VapC